MNARIYALPFALCFILAGSPAYCLDFDGDGIDDPVGYENQNDGSPNELAYTYILSSTGETLRYEFGKAKEFPALADYDGDGITDFAAVGAHYDSNESGDLQWRMRLSSQNNQLSSFIFGAVGDTYISGCSFDGDALADAAYVRGAVLHVLKSSDSSELTVDLQEPGLSRFTCGDLDGDGDAELLAQGLLTRNGKRQSYFLAWDVVSGQKILDIQFGRGVRDIYAFDHDGDGVQEIAYRKDRHGEGRKLVVRVNGGPVVFNLPKFLEMTFGRWSSGAGPELPLVKLPRNDQFLVYGTLAVRASAVKIQLFDTATALPSINSAQVGPAYSTEAGCDVHDEPNDGPDGWLYKPVSETQKTVVILTHRANKIRNMRAVKDGVVLEKIRRVTKGPGTRDFFRSRKLATSFPSYMTLMMNYPDGLVHCILIAAPTLRYD